VREIAERSFRVSRLRAPDGPTRTKSQRKRRKDPRRIERSGCDIPISAVLGLERLIGARARLQEAKPQTRAEVFHRWLNEVVKPGRVVGSVVRPAAGDGD
jgi:hypothetical protein